MDELERLVNEYTEKYSDAEHPMHFYCSYGTNGLIEILRNAQGKKIIFKTTNNLDEAAFFYA